MDLQGIRSFYEGALGALRFLEHRSPSGRRFGQDADLRWKSFKGHLEDIDRIDLLVRDADAQWPGSMGARRVFKLHGVSEDDAFGREWSPLDTVAAAELWRDVAKAPAPQTLGEALERIAEAWKLSINQHEITEISPSSRLVAAGASAIAALAQAFDGRTDLDWGDQVSVVASDPATRQLAAFCGAALNVTNRTPTLLSVNEPSPSSLKGHLAVLSSDASPDDAAWVRSLVEK